MHQGMTSSDVLDTSLAVQLARAADILLADLDALLAAIKRRADEHKYTPTIGRSHGIHAEPVTFGLKLAAGLCRVRPLPRAAGRGARRDRHLRDLAARSAPSPISTRRWKNMSPSKLGPDARAGLDPGHPARPPRDVLRHAGRHRQLDRAAGDRSPPSAAHRSARGRGIFLARPEGLERDAAQAQPGADREPHRPRPHGPRRGDAGAGECRAVARARHLALLGRALHRPRRRRSRSISRSPA